MTCICFDLNFADCELDTVSLTSGHCRTECLKYSSKNTAQNKTFMWSEQEPKLKALNYEKYETLLLAENWLDTTFQEAKSFQLIHPTVGHANLYAFMCRCMNASMHA